jgi:hypothetical protein
MSDIVILNQSRKSGNYEYNGEATSVVSEDRYDAIKTLCSFKEGLYQINIVGYVSCRGKGWYVFKGLYRKNGVQCVLFNVQDLREFEKISELIKKEWNLNRITGIDSEDAYYKTVTIRVFRK